MLEAWRIVKLKHVATAFSGEGAAKYGGRWNSRNVSVIYASRTKSLAVLETLVHLNPPVHFKYVAFCLQFEESLLEKVSPLNLPSDWAAEPPELSSKVIGDVWVRKARSAILEVPSVVIPGEPNYILNPAHSDFSKIIIGKPEPFTLDPRLLR